MPAPTPRKAAAVAAGAAIAGLSLIPFFWSTTFFTDDHLLLAFARYTPNPLAAFRHDLHGGEFYRPLSMSLWWLLARLGHGTIWPFAIAAAALHGLVACQVAWLVRAMSADAGDYAAAVAAGLFFWLSPETREAALWFAAFPDLLGTAFVLGALLALLRGRHAAAVALAACAYLTKEATIVLPALAALLLFARGLAQRPVAVPRYRLLATSVLLAVLAAAYLFVRWRVLGGWGGFSDEHASFLGKIVQVASGLVHVVMGADIFPEALAWGSGVCVLSVALFTLVRRARGGDLRARDVVAPVAFTAIAVSPLFAIGWIVGARYFYLPAVGLAWLVGCALGPVAPTWRIGGLLVMLALGGAQTLVRHGDTADYDRRVDAARRAVADGFAHGHRVFHIAAGIKDLDLAVKEAPALRAAEDRLLILGDVPSSFVAIPEDLEGGAAFLIAVPPFPPSGAYHFGPRRVVGLARRGDDPTLDEVLAHFPDLRLIRLRPTPGGRIIPRDVTDEVRRDLE